MFKVLGLTFQSFVIIHGISLSNYERLDDVENYADGAAVPRIPSEDQNTADGLKETIPGDPVSDYPTYATIPRTGFSCRGRVNWGYYADTETACQVFHVCETESSKLSFLCPIGSVFNQQLLVCDWWYNYDCSWAERTADDEPGSEPFDYRNDRQNESDLEVPDSGGSKGFTNAS